MFGTTSADAPVEKQELSIHHSNGMIFEYFFSELKESRAAILQRLG